MLVEMPADAPLIDYVNAPGVVNCLASVHVTSWARGADGTYFGGRAAMAVRGRRPFRRHRRVARRKTARLAAMELRRLDVIDASLRASRQLA